MRGAVQQAHNRLMFASCSVGILLLLQIQYVSAACSANHTILPGDICSDVASKNGLSLQELLARNPTVNCSSLVPGEQLCIQVGSCEKTYTIKPGDICFNINLANMLTQQQLLDINPGIDCAALAPGQVLCIQAPGIGIPATCDQVYTVMSEDSCAAISTHNGITQLELQTWNPTLDCSTLQMGQALCVHMAAHAAPAPQPLPPSPNPAPMSPASTCEKFHTVVSGDFCYDLALKNALTQDQLQALNPAMDCSSLPIGQQLCVQAPGVGIPDTCDQVYVAVTGDSCAAISTAHNITQAQLQDLNPGMSCSTLQAGQAVCVHNGTQPGPATSPSPHPPQTPPAPKSPSPASEATSPASTPAPTCEKYHTVVSGDFCFDLALANALTQDQLQALNPAVDCSNLPIGLQLCVKAPGFGIPDSCSATYIAAQGDTCGGISAAHGLSLTQLQALNPTLQCSMLQQGQALCVQGVTVGPQASPSTLSPLPQPGSLSPQPSTSSMVVALIIDLQGPDLSTLIARNEVHALQDATCQVLSAATGAAGCSVSSTSAGSVVMGVDLVAAQESGVAALKAQAANVVQNPDAYFSQGSYKSTYGVTGITASLASPPTSPTASNPQPAPTSSAGSSTNLGAIIGGAVGGAAAVLIACAALAVFVRWRSRAREFDVWTSSAGAGISQPTASAASLSGVSMVPGPASHASRHSDLAALVKFSIHVAEDIFSLPLGGGGKGGMANRARCSRMVRLVRESSLMLHALQTELGSASQSSRLGGPLREVLTDMKDVLVRTKACIAQWAHASRSSPQVVIDMFCLPQHEQDLNDAYHVLVNALRRLSMQLQDLGIYVKPGRQQLATISLDSRVTDAYLAEDTRTDLQEFVHILANATSGDSEQELNPGLKDSICIRYGSCGLNFIELLNQAKSMARADRIVGTLNDLSYIRFEDIHGMAGPGTPLDYLCMGGYGIVYKGIWKGEVVAVKRMEALDIRTSPEDIAREAYIMSSCRHPNIAVMFGLATEASSRLPCLVMKYYPLGSLRDVLDEYEADGRVLSLHSKFAMARDVVRGMMYLHGRPHEMVTHGDLKPDNLLVDADMRVHISDFGLSSMKTVTKTIVPGSAARSVVHSAPELLQGLLSTGSSRGGRQVKRTREADVYAFAMVLFELFTGIMPFAGATNEGQVVGCVTNGMRPVIPVAPWPTDTEYLTDPGMGVAPDAPSGASTQSRRSVPAPVAQIIERCWVHQPDQRPTFPQVSAALDEAAAALQVTLED